MLFQVCSGMVAFSAFYSSTLIFFYNFHVLFVSFIYFLYCPIQLKNIRFRILCIGVIMCHVVPKNFIYYSLVRGLPMLCVKKTLCAMYILWHCMNFIMFVFWTTHPNLGFFVLSLFGKLFCPQIILQQC